MLKKIITSLFCFAVSFAANAHSWPFSPAIQVGDTLYLSGHMGFDYDTGILVSGGIRPETEKTMLNIQKTLKDYGFTFAELVKCTVLLTNMDDWIEMNAVYRSFFPDNRFPARSAYGVSRLALNGHVEIECIAAKLKR